MTNEVETLTITKQDLERIQLAAEVFGILKTSLNHCPVELNGDIVTVGVPTFSIDNVPSITVRPPDRFCEDQERLQINVASTGVTVESIKVISDILAEIHEKHDLILEQLKRL